MRLIQSADQLFEDNVAGQQKKNMLQRDEFFEKFLSQLGNHSQEPLPWKKLKPSIPLLDKNFPYETSLINHRRQLFLINCKAGIKSHWTSLDQKLIIWIIFKYTERIHEGSMTIIQDIQTLNEADWAQISQILDLKVECVRNQWKMLCPISCKDLDWQPEEDELVHKFIQNQKQRKYWKFMSDRLFEKTGWYRSPRKIRERWHNHLNPNINKRKWYYEEDKKLLELVRMNGNKWSKISRFLAGRNENMVKNRYKSLMRKLAIHLVKPGLVIEEISEQLLQRLHSNCHLYQRDQKQSDQTCLFRSKSVTAENQNQRMSFNIQQSLTTVTKRISKNKQKIKQIEETIGESYSSDTSNMISEMQLVQNKQSQELVQIAEKQDQQIGKDNYNQFTPLNTFSDVVLKQDNINSNCTKIRFTGNEQQQHLKILDPNNDVVNLPLLQQQLQLPEQFSNTYIQNQVQPLLFLDEKKPATAAPILQSGQQDNVSEYLEHGLDDKGENLDEDIFFEDRIRRFL